MSNSINPVKRAAAGLTRGHSRLSVFAASTAAAGVLGAAACAVGSAPWSQAAGDAAKAVQSGSPSAAGHPAAAVNAAAGTKVQLDALRSAATDGSAVGAIHLGVANHQAVKPAVHHAAKPAPAKHAAKPKPKHKPKARHKAKHAGTYHIWDSVTPENLPAGHAAAVYANGAYKAYGHQVKHQKSVLWIDTNGSNPGANVLDVEPGDATPAGAAAWAQQRLAKHSHSVAIIYTMRSSWQAVKDHVAHLPKSQQDNVRYWIADPTGVDHIVPGAAATQWYWGTNVDISTAKPNFTEPR
jgi:hypothetical protein